MRDGTIRTVALFLTGFLFAAPAVAQQADGVKIGTLLSTATEAEAATARSDPPEEIQAAQAPSALAQELTLGASAQDDVVYFTPRYSGFQVGLTYGPDETITSVAPAQGAAEGASRSDPNSPQESGVAVGLNYTESLGEVDLSLSGAVGQLNGLTPSLDGEDLNGVQDEVAGYSVGAAVGFGGFTLGGSYGRLESGDAYSAGAAFDKGPWTIGITYFLSEDEAVAALSGESEDEERMAVKGEVRYAIGPGLSADAGLVFGDAASGAAGDSAARGVLGYLGLRYRF